MKRWISTIVAGSFVVLAVQGGGTAIAAKGQAPPAAASAVWPDICMFSHRNQDDPIVFPRKPGRSHDHTYFGNRSTNAMSTPASLRRNPRTSCLERADGSAYWAPTLFVAGRPVQPLGVLVLLRRLTNELVEPFPPGLRMIAGNMHARRAQSSRVTSWNCATDGKRKSTMPTCPPARFGHPRGRRLILRVAFPDCWDGKRLDSPNHKRHMAYSSNRLCPDSHPVEMPALSFSIFYKVSGGPTTELASGGQFSGHADFVNAWSGPKLAGLLGKYLNAPDAILPTLGPPDPTGWVCEGCP